MMGEVVGIGRLGNAAGWAVRAGSWSTSSPRQRGESLATSRLLGTVRFAVLGGSALGFPALVCAQPFLLSEAVRRMATYLYL